MKSGHHRVGPSGHLRSEWVVNIDWNEWSKSAGKRTLGFIFFDPIAINNSGRIFGSGFLGMVDNIPESWTRFREVVSLEFSPRDHRQRAGAPTFPHPGPGAKAKSGRHRGPGANSWQQWCGESDRRYHRGQCADRCPELHRASCSVPGRSGETHPAPAWGVHELRHRAERFGHGPGDLVRRLLPADLRTLQERSGDPPFDFGLGARLPEVRERIQHR